MWAFGTILGSFFNVVAWRVPKGESVVAPRSRCPACGHTLTAWELVPVLSWLWLRGRCKQCGVRISSLYPLGELATGILFLWAFTRYGIQWETLLGLFLASIVIIASLIDMQYRIIPNWLVLLALVGGIVGWVLLPLPRGILASLAGMLPGGLLLLLVNLISRGGLGEGDVKLAAVLGLFMGWQAAVIGMFFSIAIGGLAAVILLTVRKVQRKDAIPFGPFLAIGFWLAYLYGNAIFNWYVNLAFMH